MKLVYKRIIIEKSENISMYICEKVNDRRDIDGHGKGKNISLGDK